MGIWRHVKGMGAPFLRSSPLEANHALQTFMLSGALWMLCADRVFGILREKNPELTGERRRTVLKPPQVAREGTKKTVFTNFMDLCKAMNRQQEHVSMYLLAELGTSGSLDGQQRLIVKGRFLPKSFETVLRRYVNEWVYGASRHVH